MPIYEFLRELDNVVVEKRFSMNDCPKFIICEDGVKANKIFSILNIQIHNSNNCLNDQNKMRQEALDMAEEIGMRNFVPMKHQTPKQQIRDLKENRSLFAEKMAEGQEKTLKKQQEKMKAISEKNRSKQAVEKYMRRRERQKIARQKMKTITV